MRDRQREHEGDTLGRVWLGPDAAAVRANAIADGQAQTHAGAGWGGGRGVLRCTAAVRALEDLGGLKIGEARSLIRDFHCEFPMSRARADCNGGRRFAQSA